MFKVSMLLSNGYDILLKKEENNGQITYCIPFEIANTELGAKRKLNSKLKSSGIGYSFLKEMIKSHLKRLYVAVPPVGVQ